MSSNDFSAVELEPHGAPCTASVIWLHGLGATGNDFPPIVPELGLDPELKVRFVFPHSPSIPITINGGLVMPGWYDIFGMEPSSPQDEPGILSSHALIESYIEREERRGVPPERVLLAGFSQGGAIALHVGLRRARPLAGVIALSTYLVRGDRLAEEATPGGLATPILMAHGTQDPMVVYARGAASRASLVAAGVPVEWHEYPMQHEVCLPEIKVMGRFLGQRLGPALGADA